ncbi:AraC family transcriptional regulator [Paenibacillus harenae]|uniref:AraC family transcriptional regulator n=1 Tax=Paenibacillus harenae TaxID=306543 RepID=UPI000420F77C|nr:helix-turn-helix domain-containing protein [Paenibacillus harenae]
MDQTPFLEPNFLYHVYVKGAKHFQKTDDIYDHWALFIVEEGQFDFRMGVQAETAVQGDLVLCPPGITFYRKTNGLSFHMLGFQWNGGLRSEDLSGTAFPLIGKFRLLNNRRMNSTLSLLREAYDLDPGIIRGYKQHLLRDLMVVRQMESYNRKLDLLYSENPLLQRAVRLLQQQAEFGVPLKSVAAELGISQVQLTRLFKQEFNTTPSAYAASLRLDKVKQLLANSSLTLAQIADHCGFTDEHHLSKSFKKQHGINPSSYRKAHSV